MKKIIAIVFSLTVWAHVNSFGQEQLKEAKQIRLICSASKFQIENPPLFIVNDKYVLEVIDILNPDDIKEMIMLRNNTDSLTKVYGIKAKGGIAKVYFKDNIELLNLNETLSQLNIKQDDRILDIYVNDKKILNRDQFIATKSWIKKVEVTHKFNNDGNKIKYINLRTTF